MNSPTITPKATLAAAMLAMAAPAYAGGSISVSVQPRNADEAHAMRTGMLIYTIVNDARGGGLIRQNGSGNAAGLAQYGSGNLGIVHQEGSGHTGTLTQNGDGNAHALFQFGNNTSGHVAQNGGDTGATFQFGW